MTADGRGQVPPQLDAVDDQTVGVVQELDHRDPYRGRGGHLFGCSQGTGLAGRHGIDAGLAPGGQHVADVLAHRRPAGYRRRRAVLQVVGMGDHRQGPVPVLGQGCQSGFLLVGFLPSRRVSLAHGTDANGYGLPVGQR